MRFVTGIFFQLLFYIPEQQDWGGIRRRNRPKNVIGGTKN